MSRHMLALASTALLFIAVNVSGNAQSPEHPKWVGTWAASPMLAEGGFRVHPFAAVTLREIVHISNGGAQVRVRFTNEFGVDGLTISDAHVAVSAGGGAIKEGTDHALTFGGASGVRIPPGAVMYSDPVAMTVEARSDVAVSFLCPVAGDARRERTASFADQDNYMADGDVAGATTLPRMQTHRRLWNRGIFSTGLM